MSNYHFKVKGHPIGFVIESDSEDKALEEFILLSKDGNTGIAGFTYHDIESVSIVPEKSFYMLGDMQVF